MVVLLAFFSISTYAGASRLIERPAPHVFVVAVGIDHLEDTHFSSLRSPEREARAVYNGLTDPATGLLSSGTLLLGSAATALAILEALKNIATVSIAQRR